MWISDQWKDYELLDCRCGEKLERWGDYILRRPDPQIIWTTEPMHSGWDQVNAQYHRSSSGGGQWSIHKLPSQWKIGYKDLVFSIKPMNFKHTGLFPEQAVNWDFAGEKIRASERKLNVLNLFAYTGGATVASAKAGANVCHVDAAKGMLTWANENAKINHLPAESVRWILDDCEKFVRREIRRRHHYDAIIMDPPSYGRGPNKEIWRLEDKIYDFLMLCCQLFDEKSDFLILNSYTTGLAPSVLEYLLKTTVVKNFGGYIDCQELGLPVSGTDLVLPCGATARWMRQL